MSIFVNCAHRTIHNTLYTIAHLERLLFSAIVHCLHLLVLPPAICCSSNIAKKAKKRKLLKSSISKSLLSSGFKHILLPMRIVSLYQSNGLYFSSPSVRQDMAMLLRISVILVCCIFGIVSNSQINRVSTAQ